jgi:hypothetical protein
LITEENQELDAKIGSMVAASKAHDAEHGWRA